MRLWKKIKSRVSYFFESWTYTILCIFIVGLDYFLSILTRNEQLLPEISRSVLSVFIFCLYVGELSLKLLVFSATFFRSWLNIISIFFSISSLFLLPFELLHISLLAEVSLFQFIVTINIFSSGLHYFKNYISYYNCMHAIFSVFDPSAI